MTPICVRLAPPSPCDAGQAEVGHFHFAAAGEHDVLGFDVAVDDALARRFGECGSHLAEDIERELRRERSAAANDFAKIAAGDVFLGDVVDAVFLADFVDLHDAGMHKRGGGPRFVIETGGRNSGRGPGRRSAL